MEQETILGPHLLQFAQANCRRVKDGESQHPLCWGKGDGDGGAGADLNAGILDQSLLRGHSQVSAPVDARELPEIKMMTRETHYVRINNPKKIWETRIDQIGKKKILYISITDFPDSESDVWTGFITSVSALKKNADAIIIDLRGNSGGDDAKGMELAQLLFGHPFEHPIIKQYRSQTPETLALAVTKIKVGMINKKKLKVQIPPYLLKEFEDSQEQYKLALSGQLPQEYIRTGKGGGKRSDPITGFKKPIYILMDRVCASSCEFTIAAFEWNEYVKRVGENTNGTFHFSNSGMVILPNSKFKVNIPTQYSEYYDQRFIERIGFTPDVKVSAGDDAYAVTKKILDGQ